MSKNMFCEVIVTLTSDNSNLVSSSLSPSGHFFQIWRNSHEVTSEEWGGRAGGQTENIAPPASAISKWSDEPMDGICPAFYFNLSILKLSEVKQMLKLDYLISLFYSCKEPSAVVIKHLWQRYATKAEYFTVYQYILLCKITSEHW